MLKVKGRGLLLHTTQGRGALTPALELMLNLNTPLAGLKGADYNPREIDEATLALLRESVQTLGIVKPILTRKGTIVAGHQRTKALRAIGIDHAPAYELAANTTTYDEVTFNQLHNGTDLDEGDEDCFVEGGFTAEQVGGFVIVDPLTLRGNFRGRQAVVRDQICRLILKYGGWGASVITQSGRVIHCAQYALCAAITLTPLTAFVIADEDEEKYASRLGRVYGRFSYKHIERKSYVQSLAQPYRLRGEAGEVDEDNRGSYLYKELANPWLAKNPGARVIDFGAGQGDHARHCRSKGYTVQDLEFWRRKGGARELDRDAINGMIDRALLLVSGGKRTDAMICDSVLNSCDSDEAQKAVVTCLNALTEPGAPLFIATRSMGSQTRRESSTKTAGKGPRLINFLDDAGFSAIYREGVWFYQHFMTPERFQSLAAYAGFEWMAPRKEGKDSFVSTWVKRRELPWEQVEAALRFEFDLITPSGNTGRGDDAVETLRKFYP